MRNNIAKRVGLPVFMLAGAMAVAGASYGAIPDSAGVIHSCYKKLNGQLRVIDTSMGGACTSAEIALNFNQTGPQGPKGDKGDKGDQGIQGIQGFKGDQGIQGVKGDTGTAGAAGPAGTSKSYAARGATSPLSVAVPAGNYAVIAQAELYNGDGDRQIASCSIQGVVVQAQYLEAADGSDSEETIIPITGVATLASAGNITIACGGFAIQTNQLILTVIKVDTIN